VGKSQLSLTLPAETLPIPLVVEVTDEADGGGVMGCGGGVVEPSPIGRMCTTDDPLPPEPLAPPVVELLPLPLGDPSSAEFRSRVTRRTAPTRSLAIRDQDSMRLWASQQAAGPRPLISSQIAKRMCLRELRFSSLRRTEGFVA